MKDMIISNDLSGVTVFQQITDCVKGKIWYLYSICQILIYQRISIMLATT